MYFKVTIEPSGKTLFVKPDETILSAGLRQQFDLPYSCEEGECATCMGRLMQGDIGYPHIEPCCLSQAEEEQGNILLCSAVPKSDCILWLEGITAPEDIPPKTITCPLVLQKPLNEKLTHLIASIPADVVFHWQAGQYVTLENSNPYTIANAPSNEVHFVIQHDIECNQKLLNTITKNEAMEITGPQGSCVYRREPEYPIIVMAGGTGFAQTRAIVVAAIQDDYTQPVHVFWGARSPQDFHSQDLLNEWASLPNVTVTQVVSEQHPDWSGQTGLIHEAVLATFSDLAHMRCYASGSAAMIKVAHQAFANAGICPDCFYTDMLDYT